MVLSTRWQVTGATTKRKKHALKTLTYWAASGLIAGEALMGLFIAVVVFKRQEFWVLPGFDGVAPWLVIAVFAILALYLIFVPLRKAGAPDEPTPPTAVI